MGRWMSYGSLTPAASRESLIPDSRDDGETESYNPAEPTTPPGPPFQKVLLAAGAVMIMAALAVTSFSGRPTSRLEEKGIVGDGSTFNQSMGPQANLDQRESAAAEPVLKGATKSHQQQHNPRGHKASDREPLIISATNFYQSRDGKPAADYPWLDGVILVEPYQDTTLSIENPLEDMTYKWRIQPDEGDMFMVTGAQEVVKFTSLDWHTVTLDEVNAHGQKTRSLTERIVCKYVRREIRALTENDTQELMDAMYTMWVVDLEEGKETYGESYLDIWSINELHQTAASDVDCDHFHEGMGFVLTHSLITMLFEQSLQLVNPRVAMPYWEYSIDGHVVLTEWNNDYEHLLDASGLFAASQFGSVNRETMTVQDGRWGNMSIKYRTSSESEGLITNIYGQLRAPWNVNGRKYLTRGLGNTCGVSVYPTLETPTCTSIYNLESNFSSYETWTWAGQLTSHGTMHVFLGGITDCDDQFDELEVIVGENYALYMRLSAFAIRKNLWRLGLWKCDGWADETMSGYEVMEAGLCGCLDLDMNKIEDVQRVWSPLSNMIDGLPDETYTDEELKKIVSTFCAAPTALGESLQSTATTDPIFWPMHPAVERLFMFKRLTGTMEDMTWPDTTGWGVALDGSEVYYTISTDAETCVGHTGSDVFPYGLAKNFDPKFRLWGKMAPNTLENRVLMLVFDPRVDALSYVYDNFKWPHCLEEGIDLDDIWTS